MGPLDIHVQILHDLRIRTTCTQENKKAFACDLSLESTMYLSNYCVHFIKLVFKIHSCLLWSSKDSSLSY